MVPAPKTSMTLRLPTALHAHLTAQAQTDNRSLNAEIVHLLENASTWNKNAVAPTRPAAPEDTGR